MNILINFNKFMSMHVQLIPTEKRNIHIHCRLISTRFTGLELHQKNELPWKFHEHAPPLNLRISFASATASPARKEINRLRMFLHQAPKTCCISSRLSTVFKIFVNDGVQREALSSSCKIYMRVSAVFSRAGYNMFCTCTPWFSCF